MSIRILPDLVARKIAAGEVIDRPFSVVRELLDNSIDAQADKIELYIQDGGRASIRIVDNGTGMDKDDLVLCTRSHATSKISHEDDLLHIHSLGFRGEALSSIAAVSRLQIQSRRPEDPTGHVLQCSLQTEAELRPKACPVGTTVEVRDLFYNLPARRHFIKSASAETRLIKQTLQDKAAAFNTIEFKMQIDQRRGLHLLPAAREERIREMYPSLAPESLWYSARGSGEGFTIEVIAVKPDLYRKDKRYIQAFVNNRRVSEYALQQAAEYAYSDYIPGGNYPVAFIFIEIEPHRVDFNIHPAKKEVRFHDRGDVHHRIVEIIQSALRSNALSIRRAATSFQTSYNLDFPVQTAGSIPAAHTLQPAFNTHKPDRPAPRYDLEHIFTPPVQETTMKYREAEQKFSYKYLGQLFEVFLLVESGERFFIIDMHAGHERLRYDVLRNAQGSQSLIVPLAFSVEEAQSRYLHENTAALKELGIQITCHNNQSWELTGVPETFGGDPHKLLPFLTGETGHRNQLSVFLYATLACRSAVKEGERLLPEQAHQIIQGVFRLEDARCPHGRPIWIEYSRRDLYTMVGRE